MKIITDGKINKTYVQSLCMAFFHGESFHAGESGDLSLTVKTIDTPTGIICNAKFSTTAKNASAESFAGFENGEAYEKTSKKAIGKAVYEAGVNLTGKKLPWGTLTGIRPTNVATSLINSYGDEKAAQILKSEYMLSEKKAKLVIEVAKNENKILSLASENTCSVYISIPFCPSRCTYCSFISYATPKLFSLMPRYIEKLTQEIKVTFETIKALGFKVLCVYIGGGTPTILDEKDLESILSCISDCVDTSSLLEFTLEGGRPDTITDGKLKTAKLYGVSRISVNPQSLNDNVLKTIGRNHTVSDFISAYGKVESSGIPHINTDLIAGLESDTNESFKNTVDRIISLSPDNVTVHTFCVKKASQALKNDGDIYTKDNGCAEYGVDYAYARLTECGYEPYYLYRQKNTVSDLENVGYCKKGTEGIYNVFMMADVHTVFGVGAGATTKLVRKNGIKTEIKRIFSPKYPYEYLQDNQEKESEISEFFKRR